MIPANVDTIRRRIAAACQKAGREPGDVTLLAVAKTFPAGMVRDVVNAGVPDIGENYVQELLEKREQLTAEVIRWHFIGHLQSNKAKYVDNAGLAREIDRRGAQAGRVIDLLVEVNTTGEATKFGVRPDDTIGLVRSLDGLRHIRIAGLMTIGPFLPDPEDSRPMFRTLRNLKNELAGAAQHNVEMRHLSMGMTGDFDVAIEEGATLIRIGTAIFGSRNKRS
jgi:pyridoxal phosphate enzyme (YggS family)